jgi:hypothetical protein
MAARRGESGSVSVAYIADHFDHGVASATPFTDGIDGFSKDPSRFPSVFATEAMFDSAIDHAGAGVSGIDVVRSYSTNLTWKHVELMVRNRSSTHLHHRLLDKRRSYFDQ